jgi:SPP1 gp7 family putative phage head morphogenesis protein
MADPKKTPIEQGLISRIVAGVKYAFTGKAEFFGPGEPIPSVVTDQVAAGTEGRALDYTVAINKSIVVPEIMGRYAQNRALADNCDILRLAIETRKDQLTKLNWEIKAKDGEKVPEAKLKALNGFFRRPDKELRWRSWLRKLLEDYFVIDAVTIWPRRTKGGGLFSLELIDGSTIKRNIDLGGRTPAPPLKAYQQLLHGVIAAEYNRDQLIYRPHNVRTNKLYGFSHVDQVRMTVNVALRRQVSQLEYFTEGNVPEALATVPEGWSIEQVKQWQTWWDSLCEGFQALKRKIKWTPHGMVYTATKSELIKNETDEWLARVICYCLSLPPTAFIRQMNRATSEQQQEAALEEGQLTDMSWIKELMDDILELFLDAGDCEFTWEEQKVVDILVQAQVDEIYVNIGVQQAKQIAEARGMDWIEPEEKPEPAHITEQVQENVDLDAKANSSAKPAKNANGKLEKVAKPKLTRLDAIPFERPKTKRAIRKLKKIMSGLLAEQGKKIANDLASAYGRLEKAAKQKTPLDDAIDEIDFGGWGSVIWEPVTGQLESVYLDAYMQAIKQLGITDEGITDLVMEEAVAYAKERAAEMVGMKFDKATGELVENPNPKWAITDSTRDMLREAVAKSLEEGPSTRELAKAIEDSAAFSADRAEMIARTELAKAHSEGALEGYKAAADAGIVVLKEWLDSDGCEECSQNADAGAIGLDDTFPTGDEWPPAHPNCRCAIAPVVVSESDVESGEEPFK